MTVREVTTGGKPRRRRKAAQLSLPVAKKLPEKGRWGGARAGAGRKPKAAAGGRPSMPHGVRPDHAARHPVHVTLRAVRGLPSFARSACRTA